MEIRREMHGNIEKCFSLIQESCINDIKQTTEKNVNAEDLQGYSYQKRLNTKMGVSGHVTVEILAFEAPIRYHASFTSAQGVNMVTYDLQKQSEDAFVLTYGEAFTSSSKSKSFNFKIMSRLYKRSSTKRANLLLDQLERLMNQ